MRKAILISTVLAALASTARAETIFDGYFSKWNLDAVGTGVSSREATGGHPGARINISTISGFSQVYGTAINLTFM
jgi:hypothetical protein